MAPHGSIKKNMIEAKDIYMRYKKQTVLNGCNLKVEPGQCVGIIGANGCGKTTLLSIMAGIQKPDAGELIFYGEEANKKKEVFRKYIGYVPQDNPLIKELSVMDNLRLWYYGKSQFDALQYVISEFGLQDIIHKKVSKLSGGMKRRLSIACAMVNMPAVMLLDEPCVAVDVVCKAQIHQNLKQYTGNHGTIIMSTHDESEIKLCDTVYLMKKGQLIKVDPSEGLETLILNN